MSGHTPGPWFEDEAGICAGDRVVAIVCIPDEYLSLEQEDLPADVRAELSANSSLIVAAPDMLEALRKIAFLRPAGATPRLIEGKWVEQVESIAIAAIAKAEPAT